MFVGLGVCDMSVCTAIGVEVRVYFRLFGFFVVPLVRIRFF